MDTVQFEAARSAKLGNTEIQVFEKKHWAAIAVANKSAQSFGGDAQYHENTNSCMRQPTLQNAGTKKTSPDLQRALMRQSIPNANQQLTHAHSRTWHANTKTNKQKPNVRQRPPMPARSMRVFLHWQHQLTNTTPVDASIASNRDHRSWTLDKA